MPAITFKPRVKETSTSTGSGNITLAGAVVGYQSFDDAFVVTDDYFYYCIEGVDGSGVPTGQWEEGIGHLSASTTLVRDTLLSSSTGSAVSFSAGTKNVFCTVAAGFIPRRAVLSADLAKTNSTPSNVTDLTLKLESGRRYAIEARFFITGAVGGHLILFNGGSVTATTFIGESLESHDGLPASATFWVLSGGFSGAADGFTICQRASMSIEVNAGGTFIPTFAQAITDAAAETLLEGSWIEARLLN